MCNNNERKRSHESKRRYKGHKRSWRGQEIDVNIGHIYKLLKIKGKKIKRINEEEKKKKNPGSARCGGTHLSS